MGASVRPLVAVARLLVLSLFILTGSFAAHAQTCTAPTIVLIGGSNPSCLNQPVTLDAGGGWTSYLWSTGATDRYLTVTPPSTTSYTVTVTDASGCSVTSDPFVLEVRSDTPPPPVVDAPAELCSYGQGTASVQPPASGTWQYVSWSMQSGGHFGYDPDTGQNRTWASGESVLLDPDGTGPLMFSVYAVDAAGCQTAPVSVEVPLRTIPAPVISMPAELCGYGRGTASIAPPAEGTWQYVSWSILSGGHFGYDPNTGQNRTWASGESVTLQPDGSGQPIRFSVYAIDSLGCETPAATGEVPLRTIPAPTVSAPAELCGYGQGTATIAPPPEGTWQYVSWSILSGGHFGYDPQTGQNRTWASGESVTIQPDGSGQPIRFGVYAIDSLGCESPAATVEVPLRTIPAPAVSAPAELCGYGQGTATIAPPPEGTWQYVSWSILSGGHFGYDPNTGQYRTWASGESVSIQPDGSGQPVRFGVYAIDSLGCESPATTVEVPLRTIPAPAVQVPAELCRYAQGTASIAPPAVGTWQYVSWSIQSGGHFGYDPQTGQNRTWASGESVTLQADGTGPLVFSVYAIDSLGCESPATTATVPLRTIPAPVVNAPAELCSLANATATVEPPAAGSWQSVSWSIRSGGHFGYDPGTGQNRTSASGETVAVHADGTGPVVFDVYGVDILGCESPARTVTVALRTISPAVINAPAGVCPTGSGQATVNPPAEGGDWQSVTWSINNGHFGYDPATGQYATTASGSAVTFSGNGSGNPIELRVLARDMTGCTTESAPATVVVHAVTPASITPSGPTTFCQGGNVTLTASAGASWLWSNGATTQAITVAAAGSYSVTITDANGCSSTSEPVSVSVEPLPAATVTASGPTTFCAGGSVTLTASEGASWLWSNGATTQSIVVTAAGSYSATVTNASGCSATSAATTVTVNPVPTAQIWASQGTELCPGGTVRLMATYGGMNYLWSNGETTQSINVSEAGSYSVTVTSPTTGCSSTSAPTQVTMRNPPVPVIVADSPTICSGGKTTVRFTNWTQFSNTYWITEGGTELVIGNAHMEVTSTTGPIRVRVRAYAGGCAMTSEPITIQVARSDAAIVVDGPTRFCEGGSTQLTAQTTVANPAYLWSNGATTSSIVVTNSGNYTVRVTDSNGCLATSAPATITVDPLPTATITASGPTTFCEGGSVTLTASAGASWLWSNGATTQSITADASGSYSVTVTNAEGCASTSAATAVIENALSTPTITASGPTTFCDGGSVTLTASDGASWLWSNGATTQSIVVTFGGSYSVRVTNAEGCAATSAPTVVNVNLLPTVTVDVAGPTTFCDGGSVTLTAWGGSSWLWSNGATTQSITVTTSGDYRVTAFSNEGCAVTSDPVTVVANPPLTRPTITAAGPTTFCEGGSVALTANVSGGSGSYSYQWYSLGQPLPGATAQTYVATGNPMYVYVVVTDSLGCTSLSSEATVMKVNPLPDATVTAPASACADSIQSASVPDAGPGATYAWTIAGGTIDYTMANAVFFHTGTGSSVNLGVTVTTGAGCSAEGSAVVEVQPTPDTTITASGPTTFCKGSSVTLSAPAGMASYSWSNGATTQSIVVDLPGTYGVTVTTAAGCSASSNPTTVTVNTLPQADISASGPTTFCDGGNVTLTATPGASWLWSNGATTQSIVVSESGNFSVTVTNEAGCASTSAAVAVTENAPLTQPSVSLNGPAAFCPGGNVALTATPGGGTGAYAFQWYEQGVAIPGATSATYTAAASGSYTVGVTDSLGCTSAMSDAVNVVVNTSPSAAITAPFELCAGASSSASVADAGAGATYDWQISGGTILANHGRTIDFTAGASGSVAINVTVTTSQGCSASSAAAVTVHANPVATIAASGATTFCAGGSVTLTAPDGMSAYAWSNGATTPSIVVTQGGNYTVRVTNANGCSSTSAPATVTVLAATAIVQGPESVTIPKNTSTTLSVSATGTGTLGYQWYRGTTAISGATSASYTTPRLSKGTYTYSVRVTGSCGTVTSAAATVVAQ